MNISLPESLKNFVKERAANTDYSNPSDYIRALIRADKQKAAEEKLEQTLLEGLNSGPSEPIDNAFWERLKHRASGQEWMLNLYIRPVAAQDIEEIIDYLVEENTSAAQNFIKDLEDAFELLAANPKVGTKREYRSEALSGMRMFPLKKFSTYLVFYLADKQTIDIVRILHGHRDIEQLFTAKD